MIVGAGVTGCYLGKLVGDCEIWEKAEKLQEKPCSALLSKKGLEALDIDIDGLILNEVKGAKIFSPNDSFTVEKSKPQAYVLDRLALQKRLIEDAEGNGCTVKWGNPWNGEEDITAVGADGALSAVAKYHNIPRKYIHTYQIECRADIDPDFVELYFGGFAPGFFAWIIPIGPDRIRAGLGTASGNPKQLFNKWMPVKQESLKEQSALIPVFDGQRTVFGNHALVGDAAGQVKNTTGGGIIFGCKCAEVLKKAMDRNDLNYYERVWRRKYAKDLKIHAKIRRMLNSTDYDSLFASLKKSNTHEALESADMDHSRKLLARAALKPGLWRYLPKFLFA